MTQESFPELGGPSAIERLFHAALALPAAERAVLLQRAAPTLSAAVQALLRADEKATGFLETAEGPTAGARVGCYRLVRKLGEGGAGSVYLAERADQEVRQQVAIKLLRPGVGSKQILHRFRQERQILASLSHPNIARLLDAGTTEACAPYFVMEYVDGEPLDRWWRNGGLPLERKLELFRTVCQTVHAAHQSLVVHRDLKPSNILVDRSGAPRLVDFGIAKLLAPAPAGAEATTAFLRMMTPQYASPEQVQGRRLGTASDVYSLGVVLYELLTGDPPYVINELSLPSIERVVCTAVPLPPSQLLRARRRPPLPRDLDNVVLMALRKEPGRRYSSAQELAEDLRSCMEQRPVIARSDTFRYRASSFLRRNTAAAAAALLVLCSLLAGGVATFWEWRHAVAQHAQAEAQRARVEKTLAFLLELFKLPEGRVQREPVSARELLDRAAKRLHGSEERDPAVRAMLEQTLGRIYGNLGAYRESGELLAEAVKAREHASSPPLELADSLFELGKVRQDLGRPAEATALLQRALAIRTQQLGADDLRVADVLRLLAEVDAYLDLRAEAEAAARRALQIRVRHLAKRDPAVADALLGLASVLSTGGRSDEAEPLLLRVLEIRRADPGDRGMDLAETLNLLSLNYLNQGRYLEAERALDEALALYERALGPQHPKVEDVKSIRIAIWRQLGRYQEAEELARKSLRARRASHGDEHPALDNALGLLAAVLLERGKLDEAQRLAAEALAMRERAYGPVHGSVASTRAILGDIALARGDLRSAEEQYRRALQVWRRTLGDDNPSLAQAMRGLSAALMASGQVAEARAWAEQALALQQRRLRPGHPAIADGLETLGLVALHDRPEAAGPLFSEALDLRRRTLPAGHPRIARAQAEVTSWNATRPGGPAQRAR
jgi:serine/threonine-protein kinase